MSRSGGADRSVTDKSDTPTTHEQLIWNRNSFYMRNIIALHLEKKERSLHYIHFTTKELSEFAVFSNNLITPSLSGPHSMFPLVPRDEGIFGPFGICVLNHA